MSELAWLWLCGIFYVLFPLLAGHELDRAGQIKLAVSCGLSSLQVHGGGAWVAAVDPEATRAGRCGVPTRRAGPPS